MSGLNDPFATTLLIFEHDLPILQKKYLSKVKRLKRMDSWLPAFRKMATPYIKKWGTYKPLKQMKIIELDGTERPIANWWYDPNFYGECLSMGSFVRAGGDIHMDGFTIQFDHPAYNNKYVSLHFDWHTKKFDTRIKEWEKHRNLTHV